MDNIIVHKTIGVWMDYSKAFLITNKDNETWEIEKVNSPYISHPRIKGMGTNKTRFTSFALSNNEKREQNKKIGLRKSYYKDLEERLLKYDELFLFGPTKAKTEFHHHLEENDLFREKQIVLEDADKLTKNQMIAMVKKQFAEEIQNRL